MYSIVTAFAEGQSLDQVERFSVYLSYDPTWGDHSLIDSQSICSEARKSLAFCTEDFIIMHPELHFNCTSL